MTALISVGLAACELTNVEYTDDVTPRILELAVDKPVVQTGKDVFCTLVVSDPDSDDLFYNWQRTGKDESILEKLDENRARFQGFEDRGYTVRGKVSDGARSSYLDRIINVVAVFEDLDKYDVGVQPATPWRNFVTDNGEIKVSSNYFMGESGKSLQFLDFGVPSTAEVLLDATDMIAEGTGESSIDQIVEFHVLAEGSDDFDIRGYELTEGEAKLDGLVWDIRLVKGWFAAIVPPTEGLAEAEPQVWHKVKIFMNFSAREYFVSIDDDEILGAFEMYGKSPSICDGLLFQTLDDGGGTGGKFYVDNVVLTSNPEF